MKVATPLETAWPAGVAFVVLVVAAVRVRGRLPRGGVPFAAAALAVRLVVVPALSAHLYDGHEASYFDLFRGVRAPTRGGPMLYPAMQWLWWLLGHVLPHAEWVPVVLMALVGVGAAGLLAGAVGILAGRRAGWIAAVLLAIHPAQAAWSSSAYNVILPHFMGCLALWGAARATRPAPGADSAAGPRAAFGWLVGAALALAIATRLDAGLFAVPVGLVLLLVKPLEGRSGWLRWRRLLPGLLVGAALAGLAAWPILHPGQLPGAGERGRAFADNLRVLDYLHPFGGPVGLAVLGLGAVASLRQGLRPAVALLVALPATHLAGSSFDDYGERHALSALPAVAWASGAGATALGPWGLGYAGAALLLCGFDLIDLRHRYYGSEERFEADLGRRWGDLPRWNLARATRDCGWIEEDPRAQVGERSWSHFNLLHPAEADSLRGHDGCLRWCLDLQDWRWSSRAVRDRALRLDHLYRLTPEAIVRIPTSDFTCLALKVGRRDPTWSRHIEIP